MLNNCSYFIYEYNYLFFINNALFCNCRYNRIIQIIDITLISKISKISRELEEFL